jgi:uncharacterized membrane protein
VRVAENHGSQETLTVAGYFLVPFLVVFFAAMFGADPKALRVDSQLWFFVSAAAWVAVLGFCARFLLGPELCKTRWHVVLFQL